LNPALGATPEQLNKAPHRVAWNPSRRAAGIDTDPANPGFHHLTIAPHFDPALPTLHTEYDSGYGTVTTDWNQSTHKFTLTLPPNTTATVTLPNTKPTQTTSGIHTYTVK
jgi:alpha-L-rhamnosidase